MRYFQKHTPTYQVDKTIQELVAEKIVDLLGIANGELQNTPVLPFSAKYVDKDNKLIFAYLGQQWVDDKVITWLKRYLICVY